MATEALICAFEFDEKGGGEPLDISHLITPSSSGRLQWSHWDYKHPGFAEWLASKEQHADDTMDSTVYSALTDEDARPRCFQHGQGLLVILRGVNLNPDANPDDMVSVRVWIEPGRIISVRHRKIMAVDAIRESMEKNNGPINAADFLMRLMEELNERMISVIAEVNESVDSLEESVISGDVVSTRKDIGQLRRTIIRLRRYLAPQRDLMLKIQSEKFGWMSPDDHARLREATDRTIRYVEDLDSAKERASITQDELENKVNSDMNRTMYLLSLVAAIFLPLGFITGLLGINVGGIPGEGVRYAFAVVCLLLFLISGLQLLLFKRKKWL